jgi:glycine/D-amino acid oxidase-like deaminating enzyme
MAHKLRDGDLPLRAQGPTETYDVAIVDGGISGLSAAYFYRERRPSARAFWSATITATLAGTPSATNSS